MRTCNFARRFPEETGFHPARAIERLRVECARERVDGSADTIHQIAARGGFGDPEWIRARIRAAAASVATGGERVRRAPS